MFKKFSGVAVAVLCMVSVVFAQDVQVETVVATVDGSIISKNDLYIALIQSYPNQVNETLNRLVNNILVSNDAKAKKVSVTDKEVQEKTKELGITQESMSPTINQMVKSSLLMEKIIIGDKKLTVTDDEIKTFFEQNKEKLGEPEQVHLRQIFMKSESQINDILVALKAGADFVKMAEAKSEDEQTKAKGGDLGFFSKGMLVPEIEKEVFSLKAGEMTPVISTSAGYSVLKVEEKKAAKAAKFDNEMKQNLKKFILSSKVQKEAPAYIEELRKKAEIK